MVNRSALGFGLGLRPEHYRDIAANPLLGSSPQQENAHRYRKILIPRRHSRAGGPAA